MDDKSCVTPAGTSSELDVQNKREENTVITSTTVHVELFKEKYYYRL